MPFSSLHNYETLQLPIAISPLASTIHFDYLSHIRNLLDGSWRVAFVGRDSRAVDDFGVGVGREDDVSVTVESLAFDVTQISHHLTQLSRAQSGLTYPFNLTDSVVNPWSGPNCPLHPELTAKLPQVTAYAVCEAGAGGAAGTV